MRPCEDERLLPEFRLLITAPVHERLELAVRDLESVEEVLSERNRLVVVVAGEPERARPRRDADHPIRGIGRCRQRYSLWHKSSDAVENLEGWVSLVLHFPAQHAERKPHAFEGSLAGCYPIGPQFDVAITHK